MKNITYISELCLPSKSGYAQHVLKICDCFSKKLNTNLFVISNNKSFLKFKKEYFLKKKFKINSFSKNKKNNFIVRVLFSFYILKNINKNSLIISRSLISSLILSFFRIKNILELHHPPKGLSGFIFYLYRFLKLDKNLDYIFLHKNIKKNLKIEKGIILDDACDLGDFKFKKLKMKYEYCYVGSLFKGKGLEKIIQLAYNFPQKKFHVFGDLKTIDGTFDKLQINKLNNLYMHNFRSYKFIPYILMSSKYLLLPYLNKVSVNSKNLEVSDFMSPLKMFDYLASGKIIIASNLKVYSHILKNNFNCLMPKKNNLASWINLINNIEKKNKDFYYLRANALNTASKYTWDKRVKKIKEYFNK
ncbi:MAG: hypothetical protein CMC84_07920 [Flavobacteriaceae bacterium]|nr:hypothetical protein [Flavobacteriaceae bacterium]|tara:strand:- start:9058 stop:10137 length:1080 start_codon:yes stop_codon:yes gene_type:complete